MAIQGEDWPYLAGAGVLGAFGYWAFTRHTSQPSLSDRKEITPAMEKFGSQFSRWLNDENGAIKILRQQAEKYGAGLESWTRGGCWLLGSALKKWLGPEAELWGVTSTYYPDRRIEHVAVKVGYYFLDGDGLSSAQELLEGIRQFYLKQGIDTTVTIDPLDAKDVGSMCHPKLVEKLAEGLKDKFGDGRSVFEMLIRHYPESLKSAHGHKGKGYHSIMRRWREEEFKL